MEQVSWFTQGLSYENHKKTIEKNHKRRVFQIKKARITPRDE